MDLALLDSITLSGGDHDPNSGRMCAMEAASYIAGEPWSDHPECVCPVIAAFMRSWNDSLPDGDRDRLLKPLLPLVLNTRLTSDVQDRRAFMAADWAVRTFTPAWLRLAGLNADADALASLPELDSVEAFMSATDGPIATARAKTAAAWAAARDAAWDAARDAAGAAARAALASTVTELQASAGDLVARMCEVTA